MDRTSVAPLLAHIAHSIVEPALKKRLFGPPYLQFHTYLLVYQEAFEIGVVLGYAYRERMRIFARLLCAPGKEVGFVDLIQELAVKRRTDVPEVRTFFDLAMVHERDRARRNWAESGIAGPQAETFEKSFEVPAKVAWDNVGVALHTGIGFGSRFPDLTEILWKNEHEYSLSPEQWHAAKAKGLIGTDEVTERDVTLAERQGILVAMVEAFASDHHPEFLSALRTTG